MVDQLGAYGVTEVHHAAGDAFSAYGGAAWAAAVQAAAAGDRRRRRARARHAARHGGAGPPGRAPRRGDGGQRGGLEPGRARDPLRVTRQVVGGAVLEEMLLPERPAVLTVAGHAVADEPGAPADRDAAGVLPGDRGRRTWWRGSCRPSPRRSRTCRAALTSARVVVGAGRGAGSADGFDGPAGAGGAARRRAGRLARGHQPGLAPAPRADRPDRQPDLPRRLHRRAASAGPSSTGPAARARRRSWRSTPTRTRRWSPRRPTR